MAVQTVVDEQLGPILQRGDVIDAVRGFFQGKPPSAAKVAVHVSIINATAPISFLIMVGPLSRGLSGAGT